MTIIKKSLNYWENYWRVTQRRAVSGCCWKDGASRLARHKAAINLQHVKSAISTAVLCPHCRDPEPLHHACLPFTLTDPCLQVAILFNIHLNPMSVFWLVFWSCFLIVPMREGSCEQCSELWHQDNSCSPCPGEVSFAGYTVLASPSFFFPLSLTLFLLPFLTFSFFLYLASWMLPLRSLIILYSPLQIICFSPLLLLFSV